MVVRVASRLYRWALVRYPRRFRLEYGDEMVAAFESRLQAALADGGGVEAARVGLRTVLDLLRRPPALRMNGTRASARTPTGPGKGGPGRWAAVHTASWIQDARWAVRGLVRDARFTVLATSVLGIGIGLFVAVLAIVNAYLLRPLPFPDADRIVSVEWTGGAVSWSEVSQVFDRAVSWDLDVFILTGDGSAELTNGAWITPDFLDMYGVQPVIGRRFRPDEAGPDGAPVAIISHRLWRQRFGGTPDVLGRSFRAFTSDRPDHAESFTIVGVLPEDFWYLNDYTDVLVPLRVERALYTARLRPGVSLESAEQYLRRLALSRPDQVSLDFRVDLQRLQDRHTEAVRPGLILFQTAVLLVLLIACANTAVLLLVRSSRREREFGVRRALGAGRLRLGRQLVVEGLLVALGAGVLGSLLGWGALQVMQDGIQLQLGRSVPGGPSALRLDFVVVAATVTLGALVGAVFGLVPLLAMGRDGPVANLLGGARQGTESRATQRFRSAMVVSEVALSLSLLIGAGLVVRSAVRLEVQDLGFESERVERGMVGLREASYPSADERVAFFDGLLERVRRLPGVETAGLTSSVPFSSFFNPRKVEGGGDQAAEAIVFRADDRYLDALGIQIVRGRGIGPEDRAGTAPVAVVSERLARDLWPDSNPLGQTVRVRPFMSDEGPGAWHTVVGVVGETVLEMASARAGSLYLPYRQADARWMNLVARVRPGHGSVMPDVRSILDEMDPDVPLSSVTWLGDAVERALAPARFAAELLGTFALLASALALVGLYGVVSYAARQRRKNVAIRLALGADRTAATRDIHRQGIVVLILGVALGLSGGSVLSRLLQGQLFDVPPVDPGTLAAVLTALVGTASVAIWVPTRAAARTDPMDVLREE